MPQTDPVTVAGWLAFAIIVAINAGKTIWHKMRPVAEDSYGDPDLVRRLSRLDNDIHGQLIELRLATKSGRVAVYQFHNGEQFYSGSPIQRMTATYEAVASGLSQTIDQTNIPKIGLVVSTMSPVLEKMYDDTPLVNSVDKMTDSGARTRFQSLNVRYFGAVPLMQNKLVVGCLIVHWMDEVPADVAWLDSQVKRTVSIIEQQLADRLVISGKHS